MTAGSTTLLMPHILSDRSISDPIRPVPRFPYRPSAPSAWQEP